MKNKIPWAKPNYWGDEIKYVNEALESTWISEGAFLDKFEQSFSTIFNTKYAIAVSNGTTAIHLTYLALGIKPGDEIIVPGFGFQAVANIALHMNLVPVFAEVEQETWCLSAKNAEKKITSKTKAIVAVHTYGNVCDMDAILEIAKQRQITVIEDCAESLFSKYKGKYSGKFGKIGTFSFQATKTITTGEGGMVITDDDELNRKMCLYRSHGMDRNKRYYWHELPGHNFRLTNFQAAMGLAQLEKKELIIAERKRVHKAYHSILRAVEGISLQKFDTNVEPVVWTLAAKLEKSAFPQGRDKVVEQLKKKNIEARPGFYTASQMSIYDCPSLPICENIGENVICMPFFTTLSNEDITFICDELMRLKV